MIAKIAITILYVASTVFFAFGLLHFYLYTESGIKHELLLTSQYIIKAGMPAFISLLIAVKLRKFLEQWLIALSLLPTFQLLILSLLFFRRWI